MIYNDDGQKVGLDRALAYAHEICQTLYEKAQDSEKLPPLKQKRPFASLKDIADFLFGTPPERPLTVTSLAEHTDNDAQKELSEAITDIKSKLQNEAPGTPHQRTLIRAARNSTALLMDHFADAVLKAGGAEAALKNSDLIQMRGAEDTLRDAGYENLAQLVRKLPKAEL